MTDEPTTPAADRVGRNPFATEAEREAFLAENTLTDVPDDAEPYSAAYEYAPAADRVTAPADLSVPSFERVSNIDFDDEPIPNAIFAGSTAALDRVTALTLRAGDLREQRDEARREVERYSETIRAIGLRNMRLQREAREARAQAVQATTDTDDLRARVREAADWCDGRSEYYGPYDEGARDAYAAAEDYVRWALGTAESAGTVRVSDSSASVDPSATPDLLGRNGSIQFEGQAD